MLSWKVAPALACGNVILVKPSEKTSLSALLFCDLVKALIPAGVLQVLPGGPSTGEAISLHPRISKVAFTGSTAAGKAVLRASADSNLKKVSLELGGKSPCIVCDDADVETAARAAGVGVFANSGQVCCACTRV